MDYPSLEFCKQLKEVNFPPTREYNYEIKMVDGIPHTTMIVRPSIGEMLDVMLKDYADTFVSSFKITLDMKNEDQWATVSVTKNGATIYKEFTWTFPNALAEMILWLHANNYISFK